MLMDDLTLMQNFGYFVRLGSANFTILDHMIFQFGLSERLNVMASELTKAERNLA